MAIATYCHGWGWYACVDAGFISDFFPIMGLSKSPYTLPDALARASRMRDTEPNRTQSAQDKPDVCGALQ